jgi:hypothetical protein
VRPLTPITLMIVFGVASSGRGKREEKIKTHTNSVETEVYVSVLRTVRASEFGDGVDEAVMELGSPPKAGLGVGGEDEAARVALHAHRPIV